MLPTFNFSLFSFVQLNMIHAAALQSKFSHDSATTTFVNQKMDLFDSESLLQIGSPLYHET